jgi:hypothetical protein
MTTFYIAFHESAFLRAQSVTCPFTYRILKAPLKLKVLELTSATGHKINLVVILSGEMCYPYFLLNKNLKRLGSYVVFIWIWIGPHTFLQQNRRSIVGIYKSLTDT